MHDRIKCTLQLLLTTGQRESEVIAARQDEFNLEKSEWIIPVARAKNGKDHLVPLSSFSKCLIDWAINDAGDSEWLFPSDRRKGRHVSASAIPHSLRDNFACLNGMDHFTPHDLRRTVATALPRFRVPRFVIERILNHKDDTVTGRYDLYEYGDEKRAALDAWGQHIERLLAAEAAKNVVRLKA